MIKHQDNTLWTSNGDKIPTAGKINGRPVIYEHHLIFALEHGYVPDRVGRTEDGILYDMSFGPPITSARAVPKCRLYPLLTRFPEITERETQAIRVPISGEVVEEVRGFFRLYGEFLPMGDAVVDKRTGGVRLRRFVIERMAADGILWYDGTCFRLT